MQTGKNLNCIPLIISLLQLITNFGLEIPYYWLSTTKVPTSSWFLRLWTTDYCWEVYCAHSFGLPLFPWGSSFVVVPSLKTISQYFMPYHLLWSKWHVPCRFFFYFKNLSTQHQIMIWGLCNSHILLSIFMIIFCLYFKTLMICLQLLYLL